MAETGLLEGSSEGGSGGQTQAQQQQPSSASTPATSSKKCKGDTTATKGSREGSAPRVNGDLPPSTESDSPPLPASSKPASQNQEEPYVSNSGSEPSSPPPEDSLSSGGEQLAFADDVPTTPSPSFLPQPGHLVNGDAPLYWALMTAGGEPVSMHTPTSSADMMPMMLNHQPYLPPTPHHHPGTMVSGAMLEQTKRLPSDSQSDPSSPPPLPLPVGDNLRRELVQQLEYYFSKENLSNDKYLLSQMDGDHYVPISIIANFSKVKGLTTDVDVIIEAIKDSGVLQLDDQEEKVRGVPEKRCVLILREIPKDTPKECIQGLFCHESCPQHVTCEFAENDCWYVTFDSEEDTQKAYAYLREVVREFLGHPIRARIKGTVVQRPSAVPKKPRYNYSMPQGVYNGHPPQMQYFPSQNMIPATWSAYPYDPNYYMNGYPPQQGHNGGFNGPPNRYNQGSQHPAERGGREGGVGTGAVRGSGPGTRGRPHRDHIHSPAPPGGGGGSVENGAGGNGGGVESGRSSRGEGYFVPSNRYHRRDRDRERDRDRDRGERDRERERERDRDGDESKRIPPRLSRNRPQRGGERAERERGERGERNDKGDQEKSQPPRSRQQQKLDLAPAHFPPLPTSEVAVLSPTPLPPPSHMEEGVSNLADIVKGKRLKDSCVNEMTSAGNPAEKPSKTQVTVSPNTPTKPPIPPPTPSSSSSSSTSTSVPSSSSSSTQPAGPAASTGSTNGGSVNPTPPSSHPQVHPNSNPPPKPQHAEAKASSKDSRTLTNSKGNRNPQVSRSEAKAAPAAKGRHREWERRPGSGSRQQNSRPSPKPPRKQAPPPPPSPNSSSSTAEKSTPKATKAENGSNGGATAVAKLEKLSYAQMAQKAKSIPPPPPLPPPKTPNNSNSSSSVANSNNSNSTSQSKSQQVQPQQPQAVTVSNSPTSPTSPKPPQTAQSNAGSVNSNSSVGTNASGNTKDSATTTSPKQPDVVTPQVQAKTGGTGGSVPATSNGRIPTPTVRLPTPTVTVN